jgi:DNA-binding HxlR family transcriptional regulator
MKNKPLENKINMKSKIPLPDRPIKGHKSTKPILVLLNLLSRRWFLRILWELKDQARGFRELQACCEQLSPNTLSTRLSELKQAGLVDNSSTGLWQITELGEKLKPSLLELSKWSKQWAQELQKSENKISTDG